MNYRVLVCTAMLTCIATPVLAEPVTYSCEAHIIDPIVGDMNEADQAIIDLESERVELRVANTIGTSAPKTWSFGGKPAVGESVASRRGQFLTLVYADPNAASTLSVMDGVISYGIVTPIGGGITTWRCSR